MTTPCECSGAGFCPKFSRTMNPREYALCSGKCPEGQDCPDDLRQRYRDLWAKGPKEDAPLHQTKTAKDGAGTALHLLLAEHGVVPGDSCKCKEHAHRMDSMGLRWCRDNRQVLAQLLEVSGQAFGWSVFLKVAANAMKSGLVFRLNPLDVYGSLVGEAIRRAAEAGAPETPVTAAPPVVSQGRNGFTAVVAGNGWPNVPPLPAGVSVPERLSLPSRNVGVPTAVRPQHISPVSESLPVSNHGLAWVYGVTTVPARRDDLLPRTLESLRKGVFHSPRLFVDGCAPACCAEFEKKFGLPVTGRFPGVRTALNWWMALQELYGREPNADRYAIFQDDIACVRNLRQYLERMPYPQKGYLNLCTYPENHKYFPKDGGEFVTGFHTVGTVGKQWAGFGAQALVFSREAAQVLLSSRYMVDRFRAADGWARVDGGVVTAFHEAGWREYVHYPSLVYHTGKVSMMGHPPQPEAVSFPGEEYDPLPLLPPPGKPVGIQLG
jgi:hypothetical protein